MATSVGHMTLVLHFKADVSQTVSVLFSVLDTFKTFLQP